VSETPDDDNPRGPLASVAVALFVLSLFLVIALIWTGDGRFGWTALVLFVAAWVPFGLSVSRPWEKP
jgi:hypothetical protein